MFRLEVMNIYLEPNLNKQFEMLDELFKNMSENERDKYSFDIFFQLYSQYLDEDVKMGDLIFKIIDRVEDKQIYVTMFCLQKNNELLDKAIDKYYNELNIDVLMSVLGSNNNTVIIDKLISMGSLDKIKDYEFIEKISGDEVSFNKYKQILLDDVRNLITDKTIKNILDNFFVKNNISGLDFVFNNYEISESVIKDYLFYSIRKKDETCLKYFIENFKKNIDSNSFIELVQNNKHNYCEFFLKYGRIEKIDISLLNSLNITSIFKDKMSDSSKIEGLKFLFFVFHEKELFDYLNKIFPKQNDVLTKIYEDYTDVKFKYELENELLEQNDYLKNKRKM